jgi:hypothetical protein
MEDRTVGVIVRLEAVLDAMDLPGEWEAFLDPATGAIVTVSEDDRAFLDNEDEGWADEAPDWQREAAAEIRKVLDSGRALALPGKFEIHEWDLMRRFSLSVEDPEAGDELLAAIHGAGAFRLFRMTAQRLGLRDEWYRYRDEAVKEIARDWLEANGIEYSEGGAGGDDGDRR